jgi:hypothetical protein
MLSVSLKIFSKLRYDIDGSGGNSSMRTHEITAGTNRTDRIKPIFIENFILNYEYSKLIKIRS